MSEKTEWVTIKIPEEIRQEAKADSRTYGEIMQAGLESIKTGQENPHIPEDYAERLNNIDVFEGEIEVEPLIDTEAIVEKLDRIEGIAKEAVDSAQSADRKLEGLQ